MQNTTNCPVNGANAVQTDMQKIVNLIAKETDFNDFLVYAEHQELFSLRGSLEKIVRKLGDIRAPSIDLCRERLSQLRSYLA